MTTAVVHPAINTEADLVAVWESARDLIAGAGSIGDALVMRAEAKALGEIVKLHEYSEEHREQAKKMALRTERRIGQLIKAEQEAKRLAKRGQPKKASKSKVPDGDFTPPPTRSEAMPGVSKKDSAQFKQLANVPEDEFELALAEPKAPSRASVAKRAPIPKQAKPAPEQQLRMDCVAAWRGVRIQMDLLKDAIVTLQKSFDPAVETDETLKARALWTEITELIGGI